jgi:tetratricopeptide (TPR) repeat protein
MPSTRLDTLKSMVEQNPTDTFARYGLAMEYRNTGQLEAAIVEFRALMAANPGYAPAYFHGGQTLERMGRIAEACQVYLQGIEVTTRSGDQHARSELQGALDLLD